MMVNNKIWTQEEIDFLKENYPTKGGEYCTEKLNRTKSALSKKVRRIGIKVNKETISELNRAGQKKFQDNRPNSDFKVNVEQFLDIKKPEVAYFLGYFWADGYLLTSRNELRFEIATEDMDMIKNVMDSLGEWNYNYRQRDVKYKKSTSAVTSNARLTNFMFDNDYHLKSKVSADKILSKIPDNLKHYFFRGLVDGDGCIRVRDGKIIGYEITITSTINYDWGFVEELFTKLNLNYKIYRKKHNDGGKSVIIVYSENAKTFGDYIYKGYENDKIGLPRKYEKYLKCLELNKRKHDRLNYNERRKQEVLKLYKEGMEIPDIIRYLSIPKTNVRRWINPIKIEKINPYVLKKEEMFKMVDEGIKRKEIIDGLCIGETTYNRWLRERKNAGNV
jgi:hypothetical protein